jgi:hypothetical protein
MDFGKMLNEKLRSCLNLTGTPHMEVPYVFVELRRVVVVGLPLLVVYKVAGAEYLGSIRSPQPMVARKDKESGCNVL